MIGCCARARPRRSGARARTRACDSSARVGAGALERCWSGAPPKNAPSMNRARVGRCDYIRVEMGPKSVALHALENLRIQPKAMTTRPSMTTGPRRCRGLAPPQRRRPAAGCARARCPRRQRYANADEYPPSSRRSRARSACASHARRAHRPAPARPSGPRARGALPRAPVARAPSDAPPPPGAAPAAPPPVAPARGRRDRRGHRRGRPAAAALGATDVVLTDVPAILPPRNARRSRSRRRRAAPAARAAPPRPARRRVLRASRRSSRSRRRAPRARRRGASASGGAAAARSRPGAAARRGRTRARLGCVLLKSA